jgi:cytidylate kinase
MHIRSRSIDHILDQQIRKWNLQRAMETRAPAGPPRTVTVSRETGCCGSAIAEQMARELGFDHFEHEIIQRIAESANISEAMVATVDEHWRSTMEDWIADWANQRRLWLDDYLKHLVKTITAIGKHGNAVIVGRGASFILGGDPQFNVWRIRLIAPLKLRAEQIAKIKNVPYVDALKYVSKSDNSRRTFIRKHFGAEIDNPANYDLTLNTENLTADDAAALLAASARTRFAEERRAAS